MTGAPIDNPELFASPAEWISPRGREYIADPPAGDGLKIVIHDTDHTHPFNVEPETPWRSFLRGVHFISMDAYMDCRFDSPGEPVADWNGIRKQMGYTRQWSERINLSVMTPRGDLVSTNFCLADEGREYLAYLPDGGAVSVDLSGASGTLCAEWFFCPATGKVISGEDVSGGQTVNLNAPFAGHAVLYLHKT